MERNQATNIVGPWAWIVDIFKSLSSNRPPQQKTLGIMTISPHVTQEERLWLFVLEKRFADFYKNNKEVSCGVDNFSAEVLSLGKAAILGNQSNEIGINQQWDNISYALQMIYGISDPENETLRKWAWEYKMDGLVEVLEKMSPVSGLAMRYTNLEGEVVVMLNRSLLPSANPEEGIFSVSDIAEKREYEIGFSERVKEFMALSLSPGLGMYSKPRPYIFWIYLQGGARFISPVGKTPLREALIHASLAGNLKLLGSQDLNGGEEARVSGAKIGPFAVYYFVEVNSPRLAGRDHTIEQLIGALEKVGVNKESM